MKSLIWTLLAGVLVASPVLAQPQDAPVSFHADSATVYRAAPGEALVAPGLPVAGAFLRFDLSGPDRDALTRSFLSAQGVTPEALDTLIARREHEAPTGFAHVRYGQVVDGLPVHGAYVKAAFDGQGRLVHLIDHMAEPGQVKGTVLGARIGESQALSAALKHHYGTQDVAFYQPPRVERVAVPFQSGTFREGLLVETWDDDNVLWHTLVSGSGRILGRELRTNTDTYEIFPDHPGNSSQTVVSGPGSGNSESPIGWVSNNTTTGNNVDAYLDRDANNSPDSGGRPTSSTQDFQFTANLSQDPTTSVNQDAAVTNLFYWTNVIHDTLYAHGFTESAGNFQVDNFGNGGSGNDRLRAEAQDGSGLNNANMATPGDGSSPRMQMFLWDQTTPRRDGDLDSDIVWHEYGHGLTWRMIGNMSGPLAGAIGEGMSDVLSIYMNGNDVVGEYSFDDPDGIRRDPYTNYPRTYGDVAGSSVHADGEIYAATMWRLRELWLGSGRSQDELMDVVVDGMNFTSSRPDYEAMRDGLLDTSESDSAEECLIWEAFAEFGIGEGADGQEQCFFIFCFGVNIDESFDVPSECQ